jgi:hypothetical protein
LPVQPSSRRDLFASAGQLRFDALHALLQIATLFSRFSAYLAVLFQLIVQAWA